ncbi:MAG: hypothetical protein DI535_00760 [Citrobacter freundii]|nr:MAG: hypothetical protein DI535_00760 [Citrobacter freundii]
MMLNHKSIAAARFKGEEDVVGARVCFNLRNIEAVNSFCASCFKDNETVQDLSVRCAFYFSILILDQGVFFALHF